MSRSLLHKPTLDAFTRWLENLGWEVQPTKGCYEVLRMTHPKDESPKLGPLLVHRKSEIKEHYTTHGISEDLVRKWIREKRQ
jgi:hypothetical protein